MRCLVVNRDVEQWIVSKEAMPLTTDAGMLADGGNAVDAAITSVMALGVVKPWMCGLGGSGYIVAWLAEEKRARVIDFQGMLPAAISGGDYPLDPNMPESIVGFPDHRNQ